MEVKGVFMIEFFEKKEYVDDPAAGCRAAVFDERGVNPVSGYFLNSPGTIYSGMEI